MSVLRRASPLVSESEPKELTSSAKDSKVPDMRLTESKQLSVSGACPRGPEIPGPRLEVEPRSWEFSTGSGAGVTVTTATGASPVPGAEEAEGAWPADAEVAAAVPGPLVTGPVAPRAVPPEAAAVPGFGASGGLAAKAPGAILEGVLLGVSGAAELEVRVSSVFAASVPEAGVMDVSASAAATGTGTEGSAPGDTCFSEASAGEASSVSTTTVAAGAGPGTQAGRASPGATRVTGVEVAVVTGGPGATTRTGPAREARGGGEGAAGAP